jgi:hypothetical protein
MRIRFLEVTESAQPGYPFLKGQVVEVTKLTAEMRAWLKRRPDGTARAEVVKDVAPDAAVTESPEAAVLPPARRSA